MTRFCIPVAVLAMIVGCQESGSDSTPKSSTNSVEKTSAEKSAKGDTSMSAKSSTGAGTGTATGTGTTAAKPLEYQEVRVGDKLYVVGSKEAAEKAKAGKLEKPARGIGFGPEGVKVYFEEANQAALEAEYARRHPQ
jgi:hypothetical protein